jgi:hypothetical protein
MEGLFFIPSVPFSAFLISGACVAEMRVPGAFPWWLFLARCLLGLGAFLYFFQTL